VTRLLALAIVLGACRPAHDPDTIRKLEERIATLEQQQQRKERIDGVDPDAPVKERVERLEGILASYSEAMQFLKSVFEQQKAERDAQEEHDPDPDALFAVDVAKAVKAGQLEGPANAAVTIVKAFDFACPYCEKMSAPLHDVVKDYKGKVRVVYMNLVVHPETVMTAHRYSCAAAKQKQYLAWKDVFWEKGFGPYAASGGQDKSSLDEANLLALSKDMKLDVKKLEADAKSDACRQRIDEDQAELGKLKVSGTPALFVNGKWINGAIPSAGLRALIDEKLQEVDASKVPPAQYYDKVVMAKGLKQFRSKKDAAKDKKP
jgi:protein-disulfide isomerase